MCWKKARVRGSFCRSGAAPVPECHARISWQCWRLWKNLIRAWCTDNGSSNHESRNPKQAQSSKPDYVFQFWNSDLFRVSNFGFRISFVIGHSVFVIFLAMPDYALMNQCLYEGKAKEVEQMTKDALADGRSVQEVLTEGLIAGMSVVGEDFKHNILYVPEVLIAARAMKAGMAVLKPQERNHRGPVQDLFA